MTYALHSVRGRSRDKHIFVRLPFISAATHDRWLHIFCIAITDMGGGRAPCRLRYTQLRSAKLEPPCNIACHCDVTVVAAFLRHAMCIPVEVPEMFHH